MPLTNERLLKFFIAVDSVKVDDDEGMNKLMRELYAEAEAAMRTPAEAITILKTAMKADPHYAWSWHCNIAMAAYDAGVSLKIANFGAARFMKLAFDIDTSQFQEFQAIRDAAVDQAREEK
jgi:hypothetical protein